MEAKRGYIGEATKSCKELFGKSKGKISYSKECKAVVSLSG